MTQTTRVFKLDRGSIPALRTTLESQLPPDAEWRSVPHAAFSVKALDVVATCYESGKLVVQGRGTETFAARFLDGAEPAKASGSKPSDTDLPFDVETIGSDETGKGDYFGPIVVAACHASPTDLEFLRDIGVTDSKALDDARAIRLAGLIEERLGHEVVTLDPTDYNERYTAVGNLNTLLAELHARALTRLRARHPDTQRFIVDRFAAERVLTGALGADWRSADVVQTPRAERHPVVAAASILARAAFLDGLARCSDACGADLHKGAGPPVDRVAKRVLAIGGRDLLNQVAKLHFKNTSKLGLL